ncbi:MAG: RNA methyltransferase [Phaeodactylibacter sp.]|nr:RNA methyltransferase [Phaeodactylibacter sp.]
MALSKANIKYLQALQQKKFRQKYNKFVAEGDKIVQDLLSRRPDLVETIFALESWLDAHDQDLVGFSGGRYAVSEKELAALSNFQTPNQVITVGRPPDCTFDARIARTSLTIYLDDLQDPGNMGTILRIADWFGIRQVIGSPQTVELWNPKVVQASMGAVFQVPYAVQAIESLAKALPEVPILAADMQGTTLFDYQWPAAAVLVIGNEGQGLSEKTVELVQHYLSIPSKGNPIVDSLNAAMATSILVGHYRQHHS